MKYIRRIDEAGKEETYKIDPNKSFIALEEAVSYLLEKAEADIKAIFRKYNLVVEETATVIAKAFNSSKVGGAQMEYDALSILLFEGTDVAFNLPFIVSNMYSTNPLKAAFGSSLGTLLNLNHHTDTTLDAMLFAGNAANSRAAASAKYKEALAYLQTNGFMTAIQRQYYTLFTTKKIAGIGKLQIEKGKTQRVVTNWGIDWTGVYKK
jgi:hypothetical protein